MDRSRRGACLASGSQRDRIRRHGRLSRQRETGGCARVDLGGRARLAVKGRQPARSDAQAAFRPASSAAHDKGRRHILILLHRRNDRGAEDCRAYASERGVRLLGRFEVDGDRRIAGNRPLRLALVPRERSARHRTSAVDARRPCRHRHARGLSGKERHRPILGDRIALPRDDVLGRSDPLRSPGADARRRQRRLQSPVRDLRRRANAGGPHPRFRSKDGGEDSRRLRPHRRRLCFVAQSGRRRAARGLDRPAHPLSANGVRHA